MRVAPEIVLSSEELNTLTRLTQSRHTPVRIAQRARIVLLAAGGMQNKDIADELQVGRVQVARWRARYLQGGLAAIDADAADPATAPTDVGQQPLPSTQRAGPGAPAKVLRAERPAPVSPRVQPLATVPRPLPDVAHRQLMRGFEFARNARLIQRLEDIVGLYMAPPACALVLCCDETDTPAGNPVGTRRPGAPEWTDAELQHSAGSLFSALSQLDNALVVAGNQTPRPDDLLAFLRQVDGETPHGKTLHVISDSQSAQMPPATTKWLTAHPRVQIHFAPVSVPWISSVAWFFSHIDDTLLRRTAFASVPALIAAIDVHVALSGVEAQSFTWSRNTAAPVVAATQRPGKARRTVSTSRDVEGGTKGRASGDGDNLRDYVTNLKRERILQEAARLFFEQGYLQTSVDAIAERLGATKPFVYYHFNSKVDILVEICERSNRAALAAAGNAMSSRGSPRVRFEQFLREFTDVVLRDHQMVAIYFREQISLPEDAAARINEMRKSIDVRLTALLVEGIESGEFQIEDPRIGALVIAGMSSYAFAWYRENGRLEQQEVTDRIVRMALKLVSAAPYYPPAAYSAPVRMAGRATS
jgi:AcrR family transcriptional regulator